MSKNVEKLRKKADVLDGYREAFRYGSVGAAIIAFLVWVLAVGLAVIGEGAAGAFQAALVVTTFPLITMLLWRHYTIKAASVARDRDAAIGQEE